MEALDRLGLGHPVVQIALPAAHAVFTVGRYAGAEVASALLGASLVFLFGSVVAVCTPPTHTHTHTKHALNMHVRTHARTHDQFHPSLALVPALSLAPAPPRSSGRHVMK